jgi:hypothetical protein
MCDCKNDNELNNVMKDYFSQEEIVSNSQKKLLIGKDEKRSIEILQATSKNIGNRYEVGLLWKEDNIVLPDSKQMALKRLECFERQLKKDHVLRDATKLKINENVSKGFARKLTPDEANIITSKTWYLPIFVVKNPHKPAKIRLVYDAAAKVNNISLNDCLLKGPDLLNSLAGILWRVRMHSVAVAGDIKDMYHRIVIKKDDKDAQRFLWRDCDSSRPPDTYVLEVMTFGACSSPASAEWIKNENAKLFQKSQPRAVESIVQSHYVDDFIDSFLSEDEAIEVSFAVRDIHKNAGFEIRGWLSNSKKVMDALNEHPAEPTTVSLNLEKEGVDRILGMCWDLCTDRFVF